MNDPRLSDGFKAVLYAEGALVLAVFIYAVTIMGRG